MKPNRQQEIIALLKERHLATIKELATTFAVSDMTIRRDVAALKADGDILLVNGVVMLSQHALALHEEPYELTTADLLQVEEKRRIGAYAASLVAPDEVVVLDTGSTTVQLAKALPEDMPLTVVCYNMNNLMEIYKRKCCDIILPGGQFYRNTQMFQSPEGTQMLQRIRAHKAFVSAAGIDKNLGLTCVDQYEVAVKQAVLESSATRILLADSTKFNRIAPAYFAQLREFDCVVTDVGLPQSWQDAIHEMDIELHLV